MTDKRSTGRGRIVRPGCQVADGRRPRSRFSRRDPGQRPPRPREPWPTRPTTSTRRPMHGGGVGDAWDGQAEAGVTVTHALARRPSSMEGQRVLCSRHDAGDDQAGRPQQRSAIHSAIQIQLIRRTTPDVADNRPDVTGRNRPERRRWTVCVALSRWRHGFESRWGCTKVAGQERSAAFWGG